MNLALQHPEWVLLVDDRRPLVAAQRLGIKTICTPVLLTDLFSAGEIDLTEALQYLARLAAMQTVSPVLIEASLGQLSYGGERDN